MRQMIKRLKKERSMNDTDPVYYKYQHTYY